MGSTKNMVRLCDVNSFSGVEPLNPSMDAERAEALPLVKSKEVAAMQKKGKGAKPYWVEARKCYQMAPYLETPTGKVRKIVSGKTEAEVLEKVELLRTSLLTPITPTTATTTVNAISAPVQLPTRCTVNGLADEWWEHIQKKVTQATVESYQYPYREIKAFIGEKYADEISFRDIEAYYLWKKSQRTEVYSQSTYAIRSKVLFSMFQYAERCKMIPRGTNPMLDKPSMPESKPTDRDDRFLCESDLTELLEVFQGHMRYTTILKLLITTGLRIGELCALKWSDISEYPSDTEKKCYLIHVQRALVKNPKYVPYDENNRRYVDGSTKTKNGNRVIIIEQPVYEILLAWKSYLSRNKKLLEKIQEHHTEEYIIVNDAGNTINSNTLRSKMKAYLERKLEEKAEKQKEEGLQAAESKQKVRFHDMRHTFASLMLEDGVDIAVISRMLGHSSIAITANIYTTITEKLKLKSAENISTIARKIG